ncbi:glycoside hydrolase family 3 N-terminal domain-containing protein [Streptomyces sanglieri]|uniref:Glycoside hydrolase family 3 N-terminal domain-containing protein n=1 Tax=Streptomyces sanglieri TaxID=193460 RepID=A0ABW2XDD6_9ACTN
MTTHDPDSLSHAEQAALGSGADFWSTKQVGTIPSLTLTDGPHGVRRQVGADDHLGIAASEPATCFPPAVGLGQSWDAELVGKVGQALGAESRALDVDILLGPGVNIKRDPRCGRNFEYYSEDPHLTGVLATSWVSGLQGTGVGASLKHFAANNTEHDRMRSSSEVAPRPLREIYLRAFQRVVQQAQPWTVMCSYNRLNGTYTSQNHWLLTQVLRDEWGFDGVVVSDWGAVQDRVAPSPPDSTWRCPAPGERPTPRSSRRPRRALWIPPFSHAPPLGWSRSPRRRRRAGRRRPPRSTPRPTTHWPVRSRRTVSCCSRTTWSTRHRCCR